MAESAARYSTFWNFLLWTGGRYGGSNCERSIMASKVISFGRSVRWIRLGTAMQLCNGSPVVLDATFINVLRIKSQKDDPEVKKREKRHQLPPWNIVYQYGM